MIIAMEILQTYEFRRQPRGQYAPVVKALLEDGAPIIKLTRGEDFPQNAKIGSVQGAVSAQVRDSPLNKDKRRAKTFTESDDVLIVTLYAEGEGPAQRRKRAPGRGQRVPVAA
jgi:hypothetical protein